MKSIGIVVVALVLAALAAPLAAQGPGAAAGEGLVYPSGFLPDYSRLKPVPGKPGRLAWLAPTPSCAATTASSCNRSRSPSIPTRNTAASRPT